MFIASVFGTAVVSSMCLLARDLATLIALRALQGAVSAGPADFGPGIVRASFDERAEFAPSGCWEASKP